MEEEEMIELKKLAEIGVYTCGTYLKNCKLIVMTDEDNPIYTAKSALRDIIRDYIKRQPFNYGIFKHQFKVELDDKTSLYAVGEVATGTYGTVYKFESTDKSKECALKVSVVEDEDEDDYAQTVFDVRHADNQKVKDVQSKMECAVVKSMFFRAQNEVLGPNRDVFRVNIFFQVMEYNPRTLAYDLQIANPGNIPHTIERMRSLHIAIECLCRAYSVFPDIKPGNLAISCENEVILIDTDGIFTLRSENGRLEIPRVKDDEAHILPTATFAPNEFSVENESAVKYSEERVWALSLYAYLCTLTEMIGISLFPRKFLAAHSLRENKAVNGFENILKPYITDCKHDLYDEVLTIITNTFENITKNVTAGVTFEYAENQLHLIGEALGRTTTGDVNFHTVPEY